jgi:hypothetical protein
MKSYTFFTSKASVIANMKAKLTELCVKYSVAAYGNGVIFQVVTDSADILQKLNSVVSEG